jgi:hypothetical protein
VKTVRAVGMEKEASPAGTRLLRGPDESRDVRRTHDHGIRPGLEDRGRGRVEARDRHGALALEAGEV